MCVYWSAGGLLLLVMQAKGIPKQKMQIKPIERTKIFFGRVAPPIGVCVFRGLPHLIFFLNFFLFFLCCLYLVFFFLFLFYMLNFVKLCFIVYEVCIFVVF